MAAHEAGALHTPGYGGFAMVPAWLRPPADVNTLLPALWSRTAHRGPGGELTLGGVGAKTLAAEFGTPAYILDEVDFRARAVAFRDAFRDAFAELCGGADVYYAGKAFLCTAVARWLAEDGLGLDTCSGGELAVAERAGFPAERLGLHGNNKSPEELRAAVEYGVGRIFIDSLAEIDRLAALAEELGVVIPVLLRLTVGVEAHTHEYIATAHEDQKFGFSIAAGLADDAVRATLRHPGLRLLGFHSHIGSQIFDTSGFELAARRVLRYQAKIQREYNLVLPELDLGGGFGIAYTSEHDPLDPKALADGLAEIVGRECAQLGIACPKISIEPGRAIAGPSTCTLYEVGTSKDVLLDHGLTRRYLAVDGGMSDNIRTALYDADYSCTMANRESVPPTVLSRVVGKHCESGDILVRDEFLPVDIVPGDLLAVPGTGAYCRSMASQYNHTGRPPVVAVREGQARILIRRETTADLLALDQG
jgi:diaminopimelate decarboxylase